eukprot:Awhi_evm1s916
MHVNKPFQSKKRLFFGRRQEQHENVVNKLKPIGTDFKNKEFLHLHNNYCSVIKTLLKKDKHHKALKNKYQKVWDSPVINCFKDADKTSTASCSSTSLYRVQDDLLVLVKVGPFSSSKSSSYHSSSSTKAAVSTALMREANFYSKITTRLFFENISPFVIVPKSVGISQGHIYINTPYIQTSLFDYITVHRSYNVRRNSGFDLHSVFLCLFQAIVALAQEGVSHNNLCLHNIGLLHVVQYKLQLGILGLKLKGEIQHLPLIREFNDATRTNILPLSDNENSHLFPSLVAASLEHDEYSGPVDIDNQTIIGNNSSRRSNMVPIDHYENDVKDKKKDKITMTEKTNSVFQIYDDELSEDDDAIDNEEDNVKKLKEVLQQSLSLKKNAKKLQKITSLPSYPIDHNHNMGSSNLKEKIKRSKTTDHKENLHQAKTKKKMSPLVNNFEGRLDLFTVSLEIASVISRLEVVPPQYEQLYQFLLGIVTYSRVIKAIYDKAGMDAKLKMFDIAKKNIFTLISPRELARENFAGLQMLITNAGFKRVLSFGKKGDTWVA